MMEAPLYNAFGSAAAILENHHCLTMEDRFGAYQGYPRIPDELISHFNLAIGDLILHFFTASTVLQQGRDYHLCLI
jgi:hypothetical protein